MYTPSSTVVQANTALERGNRQRGVLNSGRDVTGLIPTSSETSLTFQWVLYIPFIISFNIFGHFHFVCPTFLPADISLPWTKNTRRVVGCGKSPLQLTA
jgi:hypothetical protein